MNGNNNIAKIFLNPKIANSDRVIFQLNGNKIVPVKLVQNKSNLTSE